MLMTAKCRKLFNTLVVQAARQVCERWKESLAILMALRVE